MDKLQTIAQLRADGLHEEACAQLTALAVEHPDNPTVQYETACVHDSLGLERAAVPYYVAAIAAGLSGDDLHGAYLGLGSTYRTLGMYAESQQTFSEGLTMFPDAADLRVFLAMTLHNLGKHHEAVASLLKVIADTSTDEAVKQYERAIRFYAQDLNQVWTGE